MFGFEDEGVGTVVREKEVWNVQVGEMAYWYCNHEIRCRLRLLLSV